MKNSPHRIKHQQKKAIRTAQKEEVYQTESHLITAKQKKRALSSARKAKIAKAKLSSKHRHHKTSPNEVTFQTEPENIHREGTRWIQTVKKQSLLAASRLRKHMQKFTLRKGRK